MMKPREEVERMLWERLEELRQGRLRPHIEEQLRIEVALLCDILRQDADEYI